MPSEPKRPCVFLDRDGTLIRLHDYLSDPEKVELLPGVPEGLGLLQARGFALVVTTNQSGVGRGYFTLDQMHACNQRLVDLLSQQTVRLDGIYYCPHAPTETCNCRKPLPGMAHRAAAEHGLDLPASFVIGDNSPDIGLAHAIGARSVLVTTGHADKATAPGKPAPDHTTRGFLEAARWIVQQPPVKPATG